MMKIKIKVAALTALVLCAFVLKPKPKLNVVFIGDSITQGNKKPNETPPDHAGAYLREQHKYEQVQIANCGVSGRTTVNFLPANNKEYNKVKAAADSFYRDKEALLIFSVMIGTNDSAIKGPLGAPVAPASYRANVQTMTDSLLARYPNARIILNDPIWYSDNTHNTSTYMKEGQDRIIAYKPQLDTLVSLYKVSNPHHVFRGDTKAYNYFKENYLTDLKPEKGGDGIFYLHPNAKGDSVLAKFWAKAIMKVAK